MEENVNQQIEAANREFNNTGFKEALQRRGYIIAVILMLATGNAVQYVAGRMDRSEQKSIDKEYRIIFLEIIKEGNRIKQTVDSTQLKFNLPS